MFKSKSRLILGSEHSLEPVQAEPASTSKKDENKRPSGEASPPPPPSPLDFDSFVPWVCLQWHVHDPVQVKVTRDEYPKGQKAKGGKGKSSKNLKIKSSVSTDKVSPIALPPKTASQKFVDALCIPVTAYYDGRTGNLVWISITNYRLQINKKLIHAFIICAPYHPYLSKLTIRNSTLTSTLIVEISNLLFDSNITDICLDDTFLPEGNYYILLDEISQLRYLSLSRCRINDSTCKKIIQKIDYDFPASKSLQILDLGSNCITDLGAIAIGSMLRNNRYLLHINLSGNKITDVGLTSIMNALKEFPMSHDEIIAMRQDRKRYLKNKTAVYCRCLNEVRNRATVSDAISIFSRKSTAALGKGPKTRKSMAQILDSRNKPEVVADMMANRIVGEFKGIYGPQGVINRNGYYYARGNFTLCSINLAYNNLDYFSVRKICEVLAYQSEKVMVPPTTGLVRVVIDGNDIPNACPELDSIMMYLKQAVIDSSPTAKSGAGSIKRHLSSHRSKRSLAAVLRP